MYLGALTRRCLLHPYILFSLDPGANIRQDHFNPLSSAILHFTVHGNLTFYNPEPQGGYLGAPRSILLSNKEDTLSAMRSESSIDLGAPRYPQKISMDKFAVIDS